MPSTFLVLVSLSSKCSLEFLGWGGGGGRGSLVQAVRRTPFPLFSVQTGEAKLFQAPPWPPCPGETTLLSGKGASAQGAPFPNPTPAPGLWGIDPCSVENRSQPKEPLPKPNEFPASLRFRAWPWCEELGCLHAHAPSLGPRTDAFMCSTMSSRGCPHGIPLFHPFLVLVCPRLGLRDPRSKRGF